MPKAHHTMMYLIGTDEAGYGPNLGPLVISATLWHVPAGLPVADLYQVLAAAVTRDPPHRNGPDRVPIADSKRLYPSAGGLAALEYGIGAALCALNTGPETVGDVWQQLSPAGLERMGTLPWPAQLGKPFPHAADRERLRKLGEVFRRELEATRVSLQAMRSFAIFPAEFNDTVERLGNKAEALSRWTLQLVKELMMETDQDIIPARTGRATLPLAKEVSAETDRDPLLIHCDKHGGRNRYGPLLQETFPDDLVQVLAEGRECSRYRWQSGGRRIEARFAAHGEEFLPAALASMASKYLRELAMADFNEFWQQHLPSVKPTAGYPVDARRFMAEIEPARRRLGIPEHTLWRKR
jgi:hypothetical protein